MTKLPPPMHSRTIDIVSYVLVAAMIAAVLWLHLLPAAIAGFLVYALARKLEVRLRERRTLSKSAKAIAVGGVFLIAALILAGLGIGIGRLVEHGFPRRIGFDFMNDQYVRHARSNDRVKEISTRAGARKFTEDRKAGCAGKIEKSRRKHRWCGSQLHCRIGRIDRRTATYILFR